MVKEVGLKQKEFLAKKEKKEQKVLGQYFTDASIAEYMSSLIDDKILPDGVVRILDCGAGHGVLTVSTALYCMDKGVENIHAVLYEIDPIVIPELTATMESLTETFISHGKQFSYEIFHENFIVARPDLNSTEKFDISVINPPYFKYSAKDSIYAKATKDLFKGDPNIYASFVAVMLSSLKDTGQGVVISPRSFLNGLYFKGFRKFLLKDNSLHRIHIFKSRSKVFLDSEVLQENIIFKIEKGKKQPNEVTVSSSHGTADLSEPSIEKYSSKIIIDKSNEESIIRIPETIEDYRILEKAEKLSSTFTDEGYFISTGPVVDFRTREFLVEDMKHENSVPLIKIHNVLTTGVVWDGSHKKDLKFQLLDSYEKHLSKNRKYVILKRFTAKDEPRRLVAGVYSPIENEFGLVGIVNKLNYLGLKDEQIGDEEADGLAALFNSSFMDNYYRCISGNTQVNATDIRVLRFPKRDTVKLIGKEIRKLDSITSDKIDNIVNNYLFND